MTNPGKLFSHYGGMLLQIYTLSILYTRVCESPNFQKDEIYK